MYNYFLNCFEKTNKKLKAFKRIFSRDTSCFLMVQSIYFCFLKIKKYFKKQLPNTFLKFLFLKCAGNSSAHTGEWSGVSTRGNARIYPHVLVVVHSLCQYSISTEVCPHWWAGPNDNWACGGGQRHGWWGLFRGFHEPGPVLRAGFGELGLDKPLGVLGWATGRWCGGWICVWELFHKQTPSSSPNKRRRRRRRLLSFIFYIRSSQVAYDEIYATFSFDFSRLDFL